MYFKTPLQSVKEIKKYCSQQDFDDDIEKESCIYCVLSQKMGVCCMM